MVKYIYSQHYKLIPSEEVEDLAVKEVQKIKKKESFLWHNIGTGRKLSVNAPIVAADEGSPLFYNIVTKHEQFKNYWDADVNVPFMWTSVGTLF
ncbi:MAG: hypothetical protein RLZZ628_2263 [Bacteroidota bacterium]|jgi:hypothetical protein